MLWTRRLKLRGLVERGEEEIDSAEREIMRR